METTRYFVGAQKVGDRVVEGDSWELILLGQSALRKGWQLFPSIREAVDSVIIDKPSIVEIEGGLAGICVAVMARTALRAGAREVRIDLNNIRYTPDDDGLNNEDRDILKIRRTHLELGMGKLGKDKRLKIVGL
jgi:hypothetical protein